MATSNTKENINNIINITRKDVELFISKYGTANEENTIANYSVHIASNKMLGFLAEYWKVKVHLTDQRVFYFFIKAISRTNQAKAQMVKETKLFEKEVLFYSEVKNLIEVPEMKPWSPRLITLLDDAIVFEDLNAIQYKLRSKFQRFDMAHTLQALKTLARFHASSIIFENKNVKARGSNVINYQYEHVLSKGGYHNKNDWYVQCMTGAMEAMKQYTKYDKKEMNLIERQWQDVWFSALDLSNFDPNGTNVICHRDLWNNNIMFHYENGENNDAVPDDCIFVDFQAVRYQPPASDVMVLLCCNLDPTFRKNNILTFLNFYYEEVKSILSTYNVDIDNVMPKEEFLISAEEQTKWGLVVCACLIPQFWIDDDLTTKIFGDTKNFDEILSKNKGLFIKKMIKNNLDYRQKVIEIFEEIADRYCSNRI